ALAGGEEGVYAGALGRAERLGGTVDVAGRGPAQGRDGAALDPLGYRPYRGEVAGGGLREAGLDDVDAQPRQLLRDLDLGPGVEVDAGRLLSVSQGGVEDGYVVGHGQAPSLRPLDLLAPVLMRRGADGTRPPRGGRGPGAPGGEGSGEPGKVDGDGACAATLLPAGAATTSSRAAAHRSARSGGRGRPRAAG